ncbi:hypothetical protein CIRG_07138 [Coccidioides immitis RMSCC 2394]|uniref:Uncharacterized protein n=1 Tax=Coccidioides immitis RMSCC 2394 TaxID=404692 RepID=A0A0J7BBM2_COCIT|nr:hypothetical protein CIRG_07138 [Coccidioides immitis RMSCC 2394]
MEVWIRQIPLSHGPFMVKDGRPCSRTMTSSTASPETEEKQWTTGWCTELRRAKRSRSPSSWAGKQPPPPPREWLHMKSGCWLLVGSAGSKKAAAASTPQAAHGKTAPSRQVIDQQADPL